MVVAERNGAGPALCWYRVVMGWLHCEALDFETAKALCEVPPGTMPEELAALNAINTSAILGKACLGLGDAARAIACFEAVVRTEQDETLPIHRNFFFPAYAGLSEAWLVQGELAKARDYAQRLHDFSGGRAGADVSGPKSSPVRGDRPARTRLGRGRDAPHPGAWPHRGRRGAPRCLARVCVGSEAVRAIAATGRGRHLPAPKRRCASQTGGIAGRNRSVAAFDRGAWVAINSMTAMIFSPVGNHFLPPLVGHTHSSSGW
jgi:hypothetical protein